MPVVKALKEEGGPTVKQPKAPFRALPSNSLHIGPSGSGKSLTLLRTLMDSDKLGGMFQRYELYSPNIFIDPQYKALIQYVEDQTGQKKEEFCHEEFDQQSLKKLMEDQQKVNAYLRKNKAKRLLSACVVIDDFGERADIVRAHGSVINSLFSRGRHLLISCYGLLLQRFRMANPTIRFNAHCLYVHRLNSSKDLEALAEEFPKFAGARRISLQSIGRLRKRNSVFYLLRWALNPDFITDIPRNLKLTATVKANKAGNKKMPRLLSLFDGTGSITEPFSRGGPSGSFGGHRLEVQPGGVW